MESSYEIVDSNVNEASTSRMAEDPSAVDLTPSVERTMFRFHQSEPASPRLDYSPSSASLPLSDTSSPHSPIGSFVEHSEAESLANLVLPRLDLMYNEGLQQHDGVEEIRHKLKVVIVGSTEENRQALRSVLSSSTSGAVSVEYSTTDQVPSTDDLFHSVFPPVIESAFLQLDNVLARQIPTALLSIAQNIINAAAPSYLNTAVLLLLDEAELPEALVSTLKLSAAIVCVSIANIDARTSLDTLRREGISLLDAHQLHTSGPAFSLAFAAGTSDQSPSSLTLEPDAAHSTLPDFGSLATLQTILLENVRKFFEWRSRPRLGPASEHASISTDEAQTRSQTESFTGYIASQEDVGTSGEEDLAVVRSRRRSRAVSKERYCHYSPFPQPGFDPLLIGIRPLFSVGLANVGPRSVYDSLWKRLGKLACVCSGLYAFGCLIAWSGFH